MYVVRVARFCAAMGNVRFLHIFQGPSEAGAGENAFCRISHRFSFFFFLATQWLTEKTDRSSRLSSFLGSDGGKQESASSSAITRRYLLRNGCLPMTWNLSFFTVRFVLSKMPSRPGVRFSGHSNRFRDSDKGLTRTDKKKKKTSVATNVGRRNNYDRFARFPFPMHINAITGGRCSRFRGQR